MQTATCPSCGAPVPIPAPGAIEHCRYCGAEMRDAPAPAAGASAPALDTTRFYQVRHAIADAAGNIYCAGDLPDTANAVWSYDRDLRLRWKTAPGFACDALSLGFPGLLTLVPQGGDLRQARTLSLADGSPAGEVPEPLRAYRQALPDGDGTYVVATEQTITRLDPSQGWKEVPLFAGTGLFSRMHSHKLDFSGHVRIALASDGDLVVHHGGIVANEMHFSRYDRQGHRTVNEAVGVEAADPKLVAGVAGIVWARGFRLFRAISSTAVYPMSAPGGYSLDDLDESLAALPDGSLVLFGFGPKDPGHIMRIDGPGVLI